MPWLLMTSWRQGKLIWPSSPKIFPLRWRHNGNDDVSNHQPHHCLLNRLFGCWLKKTSKFRVTGLCAGNSPGTGEFPAQMASNAENVAIWWRHHVDLSTESLPSTWHTYWSLNEVLFILPMSRCVHSQPHWLYHYLPICPDWNRTESTGAGSIPNWYRKCLVLLPQLLRHTGDNVSMLVSMISHSHGPPLINHCYRGV